MIYTDFIAAIDLGTSHITGIVGKREANGALTIIAYETKDSAGCIRRGCIRNVNETESKVRDLITKLQQKMPGSRIGKVYVGIGGQSVRSIEHTVTRILEPNTAVTDELMDELNKESETHRPEGLDVLQVLPPACFLDGRYEPNPVGTICTRVEAKYQQIVARPSIRRSVTDSISKAVGVAGIIVSPLTLADTILTDDEKDMGCALIDFGAGVTTLSVYKNGRLIGLCVIPLGGNLITKDLSNTLGIVEADAEQNKCVFGRAIIDESDDSIISINTIDRKELRPIPLKEFNAIIAARQQEIVENVLARLKEITGEKDASKLINVLRAGVVLAGNASNMNQLEEVISKSFKLRVHKVSSFRKNLVIKAVQVDINPDNTSIGLLFEGYKNYINCSAQSKNLSQEEIIQLHNLNKTPVKTTTTDAGKPIETINTNITLGEDDPTSVEIEIDEEENNNKNVGSKVSSGNDSSKTDNNKTHHKKSLKDKIGTWGGRLFDDV
ncbi:cell division protein FtsA [Bacteroidia bacterium]|nr:cell division protein FtsA [Bacteroidia bacterium]